MCIYDLIKDNKLLLAQKRKEKKKKLKEWSKQNTNCTLALDVTTMVDAVEIHQIILHSETDHEAFQTYNSCNLPPGVDVKLKSEAMSTEVLVGHKSPVVP